MWSLDLIKCGSFPSCFLLYPCMWPWAHHQALGTSLPPQLLSHLCTLLPPRNLPVPSLPVSLRCSLPTTPHPRVPLPHPYFLSHSVSLPVPGGLSPQALFFVVPGCRSLSFPSSCPSSLASPSLQQVAYQNLILGSTLQVTSYLIPLSLKVTSDLHSSSSGILSFPRPKWQGYESPHLL